MQDESLEHLSPEELGPVPLEFRKEHSQSLLSSGDWSREEVTELYGEDALPEELEEIPQDFDIEEIPSEGKE